MPSVAQAQPQSPMPKQFGNLVIMRLNERLSESPDLLPSLVLDLGPMPFEQVADHVRHRWTPAHR